MKGSCLKVARAAGGARRQERTGTKVIFITHLCSARFSLFLPLALRFAMPNLSGYRNSGPFLFFKKYLCRFFCVRPTSTVCQRIPALLLHRGCPTAPLIAPQLWSLLLRLMGPIAPECCRNMVSSSPPDKLFLGRGLGQQGWPLGPRSPPRRPSQMPPEEQ